MTISPSNIPLISAVTPVYNSEGSLDSLYQRLNASLTEICGENFEIVMVDDRSIDSSWEKIQEICKRDSRVKGIELSRNFGQHYSITAGLSFSKGEWVVVLDCDLQDQPEEIAKLFSKAKHGFEIVFALRESRQDSWIKKAYSRLFYLLLEFLTGFKFDHRVANFGLYHRKVINEFLKFKEHARAFPVLIGFLGFKKALIPVSHSDRSAGVTTYTFRKMVSLALDIIVFTSNRPLRLSIKVGFSIAVVSMLYALYIFVRYFFHATPIPGWTSIIVSLFFLAGLILINLGLLGIYIGKIFDESRNRPLFIVDQSINV